MQHLRGADDRFSDAVALGNAHLLRQEDLLGRNLDAEVATRHHYAVRRLQYLVEPGVYTYTQPTTDGETATGINILSANSKLHEI